eukprot:TRINITY_DN6203_c0_g2_i1.p2 TRINITY_DN6203_c0_g2~~TRINITY_DN6203_c0_g2_i1.p2  ORF type:complete len:113 (-),score=27.53 TRINITY_DN6203_c0_g2_i1:223-561(-)
MKKQRTASLDENHVPTSPPCLKHKSRANAVPSPKSNYQYYQEYCNVYSLNCHLLQQVHASSNPQIDLVNQEKQELEKRLKSLEKCKKIHEEKLEWNFEIEGLKTKVRHSVRA